jgi:hypothetical protein
MDVLTERELAERGSLVVLDGPSRQVIKNRWRIDPRGVWRAMLEQREQNPIESQGKLTEPRTSNTIRLPISNHTA